MSLLDNREEPKRQDIPQPTGIPEFHMNIALPPCTIAWEIRRSVFNRRVLLCFDYKKDLISKISLGEIVQIAGEERKGDTLIITYYNELTDDNRKSSSSGGIKSRPKINGRRA